MFKKFYTDSQYFLDFWLSWLKGTLWSAFCKQAQFCLHPVFLTKMQCFVSLRHRKHAECIFSFINHLQHVFHIFNLHCLHLCWLGNSFLPPHLFLSIRMLLHLFSYNHPLSITGTETNPLCSFTSIHMNLDVQTEQGQNQTPAPSCRATCSQEPQP